MPLRVPQNQTITSKYTSGGEYMIANTQNEYKGYYYELNNRTYAGEKFNTSNLEIVKINSDKYNKLLGNPNTYAYGVVSGVKINNFPSPKTQIFNNNAEVNDIITDRYFAQKINVNPLLIKEITEESFYQIKLDPLYRVVNIKWSNNGKGNEEQIEKANKIIPGIKEYLEYEIIKPDQHA